MNNWQKNNMRISLHYQLNDIANEVFNAAELMNSKTEKKYKKAMEIIATCKNLLGHLIDYTDSREGTEFE